MSDVDVIERLGHLSTPELRLDPTELVTLGQQRVVRRRWRRVGAGVAAVAIVAAGAWASTLLTPPDPTLRLAQEPWVAQHDEELELFGDLPFETSGSGGEGIMARVEVSRSAGSDRSEAVMTIDGEMNSAPEYALGPGGVEVFRSGTAVLLLIPGGPEVHHEVIWEPSESGSSQGAPITLSGTELWYSFHSNSPGDVVDVILYERGEVVTASGSFVESVVLEVGGMQQHVIWVPALNRWGRCDDSGCHTTARGSTTTMGTLGLPDGRYGHSLTALLPTGATEVQMVAWQTGQPIGEVVTATLQGGVAVYGISEGLEPPTFVWTNADGSPGTTADLLPEP